MQTVAEVNAAITAALTPDKIADLHAIFYLGRDNRFCEHYDRLLEQAREQHRVANDLLSAVNHLMDKTNFRNAFAKGVARLGRPILAEELRQLGVS